MTKQTKLGKASFVRNLIFGVEDSLVSTVGLVSGIAIAKVDQPTIFISGMVLIVVEALSMGVGSVLSESATNEFVYKRSGSLSFVGGIVMFFSYFFAGFVPLTPYILFDVQTAFPLSIIASLVALFILGFVAARYYKAKVWRSAFRMFILGGLAIIAGTLVGYLLA